MKYNERFTKILEGHAGEMYGALQESKYQIEYLHEKFKVTGTGNQVLSIITNVLDAIEKENAEVKA